MLKWHAGQPPLSDSVVAGAELILGVKLPEPYRSLAQAWPGGHPDRDEFEVKRPGDSWRSSVAVLLSLDPRHDDNVFECLKNLSVDDQLPTGLLPIIDDGGGDLICLDYRVAGPDPPVVYWAHELGGGDAVVAVSPSFRTFLELLEGEATGEDDDDGRRGSSGA
jgi:hypothetical protein